MEQVFTVKSESGIHARPATRLVQVANTFPCEIHIETKGKKVNAKSIMGIMSLAARKGDELKVIAQGDQAAQAIQALGEVIEAIED
ncbi:HPr family phosphocarrier protein [Brevibacillus ginsengisoli]|uniref:HPr family phosphocarrier protein n=1 Tax=Brevibacillus ginsengisoli TaxID=363854 RepID=UPI003CF3485F